MKDWRLECFPDFLKNKSLKKIIFPDFWEKSYIEKNEFFKKIKTDAENFVSKFQTSEEYLQGEKIQDFWHRHCVFCTDTITTRDHRVCYCSEQDDEWICESCYKDFKELFGWKLEED